MDTLNKALEIWNAGGWAMWPLAATALLLYMKVAEVRIDLGERNFLRFMKRIEKRRPGRVRVDLRNLREDAALAAEYLRERGVALSAHPGLEEIEAAFRELRAEELPPIGRDMKFIKVAIAAAPLWGLLGTVTGMLSTFTALAAGSGGEKTINMVAGGISEALITTETGLMIALPGYFLHYYLSRQFTRFEEFLTHLETAFTQHLLGGGSVLTDTAQTDDDDRGMGAYDAGLSGPAPAPAAA